MSIRPIVRRPVQAQTPDCSAWTRRSGFRAGLTFRSLPFVMLSFAEKRIRATGRLRNRGRTCVACGTYLPLLPGCTSYRCGAKGVHTGR